jgi:uncharacterized membrane protein YsdA (DUF1294 family)
VESPIRGVKLKLLLFVLLCALPLGGALSVFVRGLSGLPLLAYGLASGLAFAVYGYDKRQAKAGEWRIPEKVLHTIELLGGWPGALLAQQVFRHKTRKLSYQLWFWLIVTLHQALWIDVLYVNFFQR